MHSPHQEELKLGWLHVFPDCSNSGGPLYPALPSPWTWTVLGVCVKPQPTAVPGEELSGAVGALVLMGPMWLIPESTTTPGQGLQASLLPRFVHSLPRWHLGARVVVGYRALRTGSQERKGSIRPNGLWLTDQPMVGSTPVSVDSGRIPHSLTPDPATAADMITG